MSDLPFPSPLDICDHGDCPAAGTEEFPVGEFHLRFCSHHQTEAEATKKGVDHDAVAGVH